MQGILEARWKCGRQHLKTILSSVRSVTICLDGWSKQNLATSFLGISACFFDPTSSAVRHVVLDLRQLEHPHTADVLAEHLETCLSEWKLNADKILVIVSDNAASMIKAVRLMNDRQQTTESETQEHCGDQATSELGEESDDDENRGSNKADSEATCSEDNEENYDEQMESDVEFMELEDLQDVVPYSRMMCFAHSIQLVIKQAYKHYNVLLTKVRSLVGSMRKSGKVMSQVQKKARKLPLSDNLTRWNSTYRMAARLLELKDTVNEVLAERKMDSLLVSEWVRLGELCSLLKPFADQTDKLQTNSKSVSFILPALMELEFHLRSCSAPKAVTKAMLDDMRHRFSSILDPSSSDFIALPAASCLLDPSMASVMLTDDMKLVLDAAKDYIVKTVIIHYQLNCVQFSTKNFFKQCNQR